MPTLRQSRQSSKSSLQLNRTTSNHQDLHIEVDKVSFLERKLKATKEELFMAAERQTSLKEAVKREVAFRKAAIEEAKLEVVEEFRQSNELNTSLNKSYEYGYDKGVEEIIFTIWSQHRKVDFSFLGGGGFQYMITNWENKEKKRKTKHQSTSPQENQRKIVGSLKSPQLVPLM